MGHKLAALLAAIACSSIQLVASPEIDRVSTLVLRAGGETEITFFGSSLRETASLWMSVPGKATLVGEPRDNEVKFRVALEAKAIAGVCWARIVASNGVSNLRGFVVDELSTLVERGTNRTRATAQSLMSPCIIEGVAEELNVSWFKLNATKGERVSMEVVAARLGSRVDSVVRVVDARGREVTSNDDAPGIRGDSTLTFTAPEGGEYFIELRDVNYGGGRDYFWNLRIGGNPLVITKRIASSLPQVIEREPHNTAKWATHIALPCGINGRFETTNDADVFQFTAMANQQITFHTRTRSVGAGCDVMLRVENAKGELLAKSNVSAADEGVVTHVFADSGEYRLVVREATGAFGSAAFCGVEATEAAGFTLSLDSEKVEAPVSGSFELKVNCARGNYKGPIAISIPDLPELTLTNHVIP